MGLFISYGNSLTSGIFFLNINTIYRISERKYNFTVFEQEDFFSVHGQITAAVTCNEKMLTTHDRTLCVKVHHSKWAVVPAQSLHTVLTLHITPTQFFLPDC